MTRIQEQAARLSDTLKDSGIPVTTVRTTGAVVEIVYAPEATQRQRSQGDTLKDGWDFSPAPTVNDDLRAMPGGKLAAAQTLVLMDGITAPAWARNLVAAHKARVVATIAGRTPDAEP